MEITQEWVNDKLREIDDSLLKKEYREGWSEDNPTFGYCYIISEVLYHYVFKNSEAYCINLTEFEDEYGGSYGTHWFLKERGEIYDFTGNQFPFEVPYALAGRQAFFKGTYKTDRGYISKRGYQLAKVFGFVEDE